MKISKTARFVLLILAAMTTFISSSILHSHASESGIRFYSSNSLPGGIKFEDILGPYWTSLSAHPPSYVASWPQCVKTEVTVGNNQSLTFLGELAWASQKNQNATQQKCQISNNSKLYLAVYDGECSKAEYPLDSVPQLLKCAQDSNKIIRLMKVMVNGMDVSSNITKQSSSHPYYVTFKQDNAWGLKPPAIGTFLAMGESYYLFFHPLPKGQYAIQAEVIRQDLQSGTIEHDKAHWDINVVP